MLMCIIRDKKQSFGQVNIDIFDHLFLPNIEKVWDISYDSGWAGILKIWKRWAKLEF